MWAQLVNVALGIWLMAAPAVLGYSGTAADVDHVIGPLIASFALTAAWQVTRGVRVINVALAAWLIIAPWLFGYQLSAVVNSIAVGLSVLLLSFVPARQHHTLGGGFRALFRAAPHLHQAP